MSEDAKSPRDLKVTRMPDEPPQDAVARLGLDAPVNAALTSNALLGRLYGTDAVDAPACVKAIDGVCQQVVGGDLAPLERMLTAQALVLDQLFGDLTRRALMAPHPKARELDLRLALKAQAQCRTTVEALAEIKRPTSTIFAKQANVAHGPQQVNTGPPPSRGKKSGTQQNELLEDGDHGQWLDTRAPGKAGRTDPAMAAVGKCLRPED